MVLASILPAIYQRKRLGPGIRIGDVVQLSKCLGGSRGHTNSKGPIGSGEIVFEPGLSAWTWIPLVKVAASLFREGSFLSL